MKAGRLPHSGCQSSLHVLAHGGVPGQVGSVVEPKTPGAGSVRHQAEAGLAGPLCSLAAPRATSSLLTGKRLQRHQ
eukprot:11192155-Lingulodinium_polyedra.AAC.1